MENAECQRGQNWHRAGTPQRGLGRSPPGTRHNPTRRQGHGDEEQMPKKAGGICAGSVGRGPTSNIRARGATLHLANSTVTQDELRNLETALAKAQKAAKTAEIDVRRLQDELRQSSDQETSVRAQARKAPKDAHEK